ncbi:MAG TPA: CHAT domain-containing protein, partial [Kofleriaceae bacterium]|nr:CHAT domain-containing protein [Kofleriaceae bacterium]
LRDRNQIIPEGPLAPRLLELAKAVPARARLRFDDALRTATTARRLDELRPLAEVLDQRTGSKLVAALAGARKRLSPARAALAPLYVEILRQQGIADEARWRTWKVRAQAAGATDLLLGALYLARGDSDEAAELAAASGDSWMRGLLEKERFNARSKQVDHAAAARHVATLEELCAQGAAAYICLLAQIKRAEVATDTGQPTLALRAAQQALQTATAEGEFDWRGRAVFFAAEAHRFRKHLSLARAYYEEWALSSSDPNLQQKAIATVALMELERGRISEAEAIVEKLQASDTPPGRALLSTQVDLLEAGLAIRRDDLRKALAAALAAAGSSETDRLYLEYLAARVDLRADQAEPQLAARQQLVELSRRAAAFAGDATARRTQVEAERALFVDAARRERWDDALALATQSHRVPRPTRCALALVHDRYHAAAVLVSADGSLTGTYRVEQTWSLPKEWPQRLAGCAQVGVIAYPPSTSAPPLPGTLPWAFLLGQPQPASPELSPRTVIIANTEPPQSLQLAALAPLTAPPDATLLVGAVATPQRAAMEAKGATLIEFHVHTTRVASSDAPALALSESPAGWALTAEDLASWDLPRRPVVLLADCVGAVPAGYDYLVWGLPVAFRAAGARAVVAALTDIPDVEGAQVFAEIREGLRHDPNVARVVSRIRAEKISADPTSWVRNIVVFE